MAKWNIFSVPYPFEINIVERKLIGVCEGETSEQAIASAMGGRFVEQHDSFELNRPLEAELIDDSTNP